MYPCAVTSAHRGGSLFASTRVGGSYRSTAQAPMSSSYRSRDFAPQGRAIDLGPQPRNAGNVPGKFVIVENEETGLSTIEVSPSEVVTITPDEAGGLTIAIEPVEVEEPAAPAMPLPLG